MLFAAQSGRSINVLDQFYALKKVCLMVLIGFGFPFDKVTNFPFLENQR